MESPDGKFLCPSPDCGKAYAAMSFLAKHFKDKHSSQTTTPEPSNSFDSTAGDSSLSEGGGGGDIPPPGDRCSRDARFGPREEIGLSSSDAVSWPPSEGIEPYDVEADVGGGEIFEREEEPGTGSSVLAQLGLLKVQCHEMTLLLCTDCEVILDGCQREHVVRHVRRDIKPLSADIVKRLKDWLTRNSGTFTPNKRVFSRFCSSLGDAPLGSVPMLGVKDGYSCPHCPKFSAVLRKSVANHMRLDHGGSGSDAEGRALPSRVTVQCLFLGRTNRHFRVEPRTPEARPREVNGVRAVVDRLILASQERPDPHSKPSFREVSPFLRLSRLDEHA